jgi:hypothetical protein
MLFFHRLMARLAVRQASCEKLFLNSSKRVNWMNTELVGTIDPEPDSLTGKDEWIALIATHSALASVAPKQGTNPFGRKPMVFSPSPDAATVHVDGTKVGAIHWAMNDSRQLIVWSEGEAKTRVIAIATDVASRLGWRFVAYEGAKTSV